MDADDLVTADTVVTLSVNDYLFSHKADDREQRPLPVK